MSLLQNKSRSKVVSSTHWYSPSTTDASTSSSGKIEHSTPTGFPEHQGTGVPQAEPNVEEAQAITASKNLVEEKAKEAAENSKECTGTASQGGNLDAANAGSAKNARRTLSISDRMRDQAYLQAGKVSEERDVSPGTLPDGSHAKTASDRGEVYEVSKLSKFKNMLGFGKG